MKTLLSQLLRFDILVTGIVSSVLTAPSREFYWRHKGTAAARRQPSCSVAGRWRLAWRCETWEEATEAEEGTIWNSFIKRYEKKCCLEHTYAWVLSTERNKIVRPWWRRRRRRVGTKKILAYLKTKDQYCIYLSAFPMRVFLLHRRLVSKILLKLGCRQALSPYQKFWEQSHCWKCNFGVMPSPK